MKTNLKKLFLAVAVALPFMFTSCDQTEYGSATITFDNITDNTLEIEKGANFAITGSVVSEVGSTVSIIAYAVYDNDGQDNRFEIANSGTRTDNTFTGSGNSFTFRFSQDHTELSKYLGEPKLRLVIETEVKNGGKSSRTLNINVKEEPQDTPLSEPTAFTWERVGTGTVQAMTQFGLSMITGGNADDGFTILVTAGTKLVRLDVADWTEITTREALAEKIDATPSAVHAGTNNRISFVRTTANVNHVFGVLHNDNYYVFNVTRTEINDAGAQNITRVIGNYKH